MPQPASLAATLGLVSTAATLLAMPPPPSPHRQVLIDVDSNLRVPQWSVSSSDLKLDSKVPFRVDKDVLHGGRQEGVDRIRVQSGDLEFTVIPTRGMNLWDARVGDVRLGWDSPVKEVVHPHHINLAERGGLGWLEGFGEWMNRCGLASNGAPGVDQVPSNTGAPLPVQLTLHGKVSYLPARRAEVEIDASGERPVIRVRGVVDETMMFGTQLRLVTTISTEVGSSTIRVEDEIHNLAATPQEFQILYHANFGAPLLEDGATVIAPALRVTPRDGRAAEGDIGAWNRYGPPTAGFIEQVFFLKLAARPDGQTQVLLRNARGDRGVSLGFSTKELPHLTVWKNTAAVANGYVTGIEPATNYPNNRSFERQNGRVPVLPGGASYRATTSYTVHRDAPAVREAEAAVKAILGAATVQLDPRPVAGLCP